MAQGLYRSVVVVTTMSHMRAEDTKTEVRSSVTSKVNISFLSSDTRGTWIFNKRELNSAQD